jgi:hypothetical protein
MIHWIDSTWESFAPVTSDEQLGALPLCLWARPSSPACVYFLADHLDAVLAAGEDLLQLEVTWISTAARTQEATVRDRDAVRDGVEAVRSLELQLIARLLKARERAEDLLRVDARLKLMTRLFLSGTATILEAVSELSDVTAEDFETGDATLAYLRSRGLIAADVAAPDEGVTLRVSNAFLVARRLKLGALLDLVAEFLDTMELHHDIFADPTNRMGPPNVQELPDPMANTPKAAAVPAGDRKAQAPSVALPATAAPPRPAYRSLTAALAALEEQERARREPVAS